MPDNQEGQLVNVINEFHRKVDTGFTRIHDRLDAMNTKSGSFEKEVALNVAKLKAERQAHDSVHENLTIPTQPCPEMKAIQKEKEEVEQDVKDIKKSVVKEGAVWGFRAIVAFIVVKLGFDKWGG